MALSFGYDWEGDGYADCVASSIFSITLTSLTMSMMYLVMIM